MARRFTRAFGASFRLWQGVSGSPRFNIRSVGLAGCALGAMGMSGDRLFTTATAKPVLELDEKSDAALKEMVIFSGTANLPLAEEIAKHLGIKLGNIKIKGFADGEIGIQVNDNVRGKDVYIIQPTSPPAVNDHLMELILMISTMRRASANSITAVIPYYGYARQDRKLQARVPISAADVACLLEAMGVDRVMAVDLHCGQIQGFFHPQTPCDNLEGHHVALPYFQSLGLKSGELKVVSPDAGGVYRAKRFREMLKSAGLDAGLAMIIKQRMQANQVGSMDLVGTVEGCDVILVDDMIDTAGTLTAAADELKRFGARRVFAFATHGLFSGPAVDRINKSTLERVIVTNTIPMDPQKKSAKIHYISVGGVLSEAMARVQLHQSVSALFHRPSVSGAATTDDS
jgi:ribose-phosphate pyrophosphokinase